MGVIKSNMAGTVWKVLVQPGDSVVPGQDVIILESMKMEIPITAEVAGTVKAVAVGEGDFVNDGDLVVELS